MEKILRYHFQDLRLREQRTIEVGPFGELMACNRDWYLGNVGYFSWELGVPGWEGIKGEKRGEKELKTSFTVLVT